MTTPKRSYEERLKRAEEMSKATEARRVAREKQAEQEDEYRMAFLKVAGPCAGLFVVTGFVVLLLTGEGPSEDSSSRGIGYSEDARGYDDTALKYVGKERLKQQLKDPDSLQIISEEVLPANGNVGEGYRAVYRAKNGFGGYTTEVFETR